MPRMLEDLLDASATTGWATAHGTLDQVRLDATMLKWTEVPTRRGGPALSTLRPVAPAEAQPNSLSARYGTGSQPLHTDGAHLPKPPDIVVLACAGTSTTPTRLWNPKGRGFLWDAWHLVRHGVFLVSSGNDSFFATAYDVGLGVFRYDPGCMLPADERARKVTQHFETAMSDATDHHWSEPGLVLLIDNRRVLHARASADHEPQREIQRLSFNLNGEAS